MTCILTTVPGNPKGIAALSPGLARQRLPWVDVQQIVLNPEGVASFVTADTTPSGLFAFADFTQGSSQARNPGLIAGIPLGFSSSCWRRFVENHKRHAPRRRASSKVKGA